MKIAWGVAFPTTVGRDRARAQLERDVPEPTNVEPIGGSLLLTVPAAPVAEPTAPSPPTLLLDAAGSSRASAPAVRLGDAAKRMFDVITSAVLLVLLTPLLTWIAIAIKLDSRGPVLYRCRRVGFRGREFAMLKFRKMRADALGPALTVAKDERFTRIGRFLSATKLDELPQLWHVFRGQMSLVGPRPEDPEFVSLFRDDYAPILEVRPGITGLCQLAFAKEASLLDPTQRLNHYVETLLPQKMALDRLYASKHSFAMDVRILAWTTRAVVLRHNVAVHRDTGELSSRRPRH